jgi:hypothetical protein
MLKKLARRTLALSFLLNNMRGHKRMAMVKKLKT